MSYYFRAGRSSWTAGRSIDEQLRQLRADEARLAGALSYRFETSPQSLLLRLSHEGHILSYNSYDLGWSDRAPAPFHQRLMKVKNLLR